MAIMPSKNFMNSVISRQLQFQLKVEGVELARVGFALSVNRTVTGSDM
jgi:hypothetical protein